MQKDLGRVSRNDSEEIRLTLREIRGELCLELRVYTRSARHGGTAVPDPEAIVVPVRVLPELSRVLEQSLDRLVKEGLAEKTGEPATLCLGDLQAATPNARPDSPLRYIARGVLSPGNLPRHVVLETWARGRRDQGCEQRGRAGLARRTVPHLQSPRHPHADRGADLPRTGRGRRDRAPSRRRILPPQPPMAVPEPPGGGGLVEAGGRPSVIVDEACQVSA